MLNRPQGQRRPADAIGFTFTVGQLAAGEVTEVLKEPSGKVRSGKTGATTRTGNLSQEARTAIAKKTAARRWAR